MAMEANPNLREAVHAYEAGDYARAATLLTPLADAGEPDAQYMLGELYRWGTGVPPDARESLRWYEAAADAGHAMAAWELAHIYRVGAKTAPPQMEELPKDAEKSKAYLAAAARRFTAAANQGDAAAMGMLGFLHMWGDGVAQNAREAERWLTRAIDAGHHGAANNYASCTTRATTTGYGTWRRPGTGTGGSRRSTASPSASTSSRREKCRIAPRTQPGRLHDSF